MARRRMFLTGSERAEFEHIYGPLITDETDARFVLVTEEEEARIRALPAGVPVRAQSQSADSKARIRAHELKAAELAGNPIENNSELVAEGAADPEPIKRGDEEGSGKSAGSVSADVESDGGATKPVGATKTRSKSSGNSV